MGQRLLKETKVKSIHVIGHSCGAFVALGLCEAVKEQSSDIKIQTTYLDPVSVYAGVWWNYGVDKFGTWLILVIVILIPGTVCLVAILIYLIPRLLM